MIRKTFSLFLFAMLGLAIVGCDKTAKREKPTSEDESADEAAVSDESEEDETHAEPSPEEDGEEAENAGGDGADGDAEPVASATAKATAASPPPAPSTKKTAGSGRVEVPPPGARQCGARMPPCPAGQTCSHPAGGVCQ